MVQALDAASGRLRELPGEGDELDDTATRRSRSTADAWAETSRVPIQGGVAFTADYGPAMSGAAAVLDAAIRRAETLTAADADHGRAA